MYLTLHSQYINQVDGSVHDDPPPDFRGGILADTMGYGKTLEVISLIAHDVSGLQRRQLGFPHNPTTTLVVVPAASKDSPLIVIVPLIASSYSFMGNGIENVSSCMLLCDVQTR